MAKKKVETKTELERTYIIPLQSSILKVPMYKRAKKAVKTVKEFLTKHMKAKEVKLGDNLNKEIWKHGIKNPPHKVKVLTSRDSEGIVKAELFGHKLEDVAVKKEVKEQKPKSALAEKLSQLKQQTTKKDEKVKEIKPEVKEEKPAEKKPEVKEIKPKVE